MATFMLAHIEVKNNILDDAKYAYLFSVEEVNRLVLAGTPFRDAYKQVGLAIENGEFKPDKNIRHTHEGSIGNLGNTEITKAMKQMVAQFPFEKVEKAVNELIK
jgi:argininosuccinate lyase